MFGLPLLDGKLARLSFGDLRKSKFKIQERAFKVL